MKKVISLVLAFSMILSMICSSIIIVSASEDNNNISSEGKSEKDALQSLVDKVNNGLDADDRTDVTLTVPGMADSLGMDIVYITGGKISKQAADSDIKIKNLKETIREVIKTGTPVNFGIVTYSHRLPVAMPLTTFATEADLENFTQIIEDSYNSYGDVEGWSDGGGNMEQALTNAKALLSGPNSLKDYPERQHIILYSSGHTYEFNDGENNEYAACAPSYASGTMYYAGSSWCYLRNAGSSRYYIPQAIVDTYKANKDKFASDWDCYWSYITKWVEADRLDEASENPKKSHVYRYYKYGDPVDTSFHLTEEQMKKYPNIPYRTTLNKKDLETANAIIYERAMYEAYEYVKPNIIDAGINLHPIYNPINASRDVNGINGRNYVGHCFMNMLDKLAGGDGEAAVYKYVDDFYFESVKAQILYTSSIGSYVEDFIGANENGNFEFIKNEAFIKLNVGGVDYQTIVANTAKHTHDEKCICGDKSENAMISYAFAETLDAEPTFWLDYYYGDGETTERFIWTFGENVSLDRKASLTYKLQLTEKLEGIGGYDVPTNNSATFYPIDSNGKEGTPQEFPEPNVKYEVLPIEINVEKIWDDANDQDGLRPDEITINLLADGVMLKSGKLNEANGWNFTFEGLPEIVNGQKVVYTIEEVSVDGYATAIAPTDDGFKVTNKYTPVTIDIEGEKTWIDNNDQDGLRPDEITINLLADDVVIKSVKVTEADGWAWIFEDLPKYRDGGIEIVYSITEDAIEGYETTVDGFNVINTHIPEETTVEGEKLWNDNNDQDGIRPESIIINLFADGVKIDSVEVKEVNGKWIFEFVELPKYRDGGIEIVYTVEEEAVDGYETDINGNIIVNTHAPEKIDVEGSKTWIDNDDQDGIRPESITINLFKDGTLIQTITVTEENNWSWKFTGLDKYRDGGIEIVYTITEKAVEGYETSIDGFNVTNTHIPATKDIEGTKTWNDNDDQDGIRPDSIIINLLADGKKIDSVEVKEVNGEWTFEFVELPKYRDGGIEIVYTVEEEAVEGYESTINGFNVTNTHIPATKDIEGEKTWIDNDDQDGIRPESITINLLADGKVIKTIKVAGPTWNWTFEDLPKYRDGGIEIVYSITEEAVEGYETTVDGFNVINTHKPEETEVTGEKLWNDNNDQDGIRPESIIINLFADGEKIDSVEVKEVNGKWTFEFVELPKYRDGGIEIVYTVEEEAVEGYETTVNGTIVTNKHNPETIVIEGEKLWDDNNDQDGIRPENVTINLLADGQIIRTFFVTAADGWTWKIENLPKYRDGGIEIAYTITEKAVEGYETSIDGFTVTNTHVPATVEVEGEKIWNDANNQDGKRPEEITINLLADNVVVKTIKVTSDNWSWTFENLPKYRDGGIEIVYSISEEKVEGYTTEYEGFNVINSYAPEKTNVEVLKVWNDANDQDGIRPESIIINLLKNGEVFKTATLTAADGWAYNFTDLDKYEAGKVIVYTIAEVEVEGYETVIDGFTVTNTHVPATVVVEGNKTWVDADDQDGIRPESITINLLANGTVIKTITVTEADGWAWTFENLAKYEAGEEIVYSIKEEKVEGYNASYDGFNVINTHVPATVVVEGNKTWVDADDQDGIRPESITINLLANGTVIETITVTEADGWAWTFKNLAKYEAGEEIVYSISEEAVEGYETTVDGFNVTNTHVPATVVVEGNKTWVDADDQDGIRPENIVINLLANGTVIETITVTEADGWAWTFENLAKYEAGVEIVYSITEEEVEGYETTVDGFNVINTHVPATVVVEGEKIWDDNDDQDGLRPDEITINLLANGKVIKTITVTKAAEWKFIFEDLAKFEAGEEIIYTIEEVAVEGYEASYNGYIVTNTHAPETTSVKVEKIWEDEDDADGFRPESITVHLYANGVLVETKVITEADGWAWTFENLAKYSAGEEIVYTISEDEVEEYETSIEGSAEEGFIITNTHEVIVDIFDESTPLAPPATGDKSITALLVMSITSLVIGALVAAKRRREF